MFEICETYGNTKTTDRIKSIDEKAISFYSTNGGKYEETIADVLSRVRVNVFSIDPYFDSLFRLEEQMQMVLVTVSISNGKNKYEVFVRESAPDRIIAEEIYCNILMSDTAEIIQKNGKRYVSNGIMLVPIESNGMVSNQVINQSLSNGFSNYILNTMLNEQPSSSRYDIADYAAEIIYNNIGHNKVIDNLLFNKPIIEEEFDKGAPGEFQLMNKNLETYLCPIEKIIETIDIGEHNKYESAVLNQLSSFEKRISKRKKMK